jgi:iron complex transport system substrate-binding protein
MHRKLALVLLTLALALAACGQPAAPAGDAPTALPATEAPAAPTVEAAATTAPTVAPGGSAVDVTDAAGRTVTIEAPPARMVSLAPSTTEILFALGLGERTVAVDDFSNYPPEAASLPKIGAFNTVNFEQIAALEPDLVLAAGITAPEQIQKIEELDIPIIVVGQPESSVASVYDDITLVGRATGTADVAAALVEDLKARITALSEAVAGREKPAVFWELDATDPAKPYTVGPGSFVDELIKLAGGRNIFGEGDNPYPQVSAEQVVAADPQFIILADAQYGMTPEQVAARPGWEGIAAVEDGKVFPIDADLVSRPGPRLADGLEAIVRILHPDAVQP